MSVSERAPTPWTVALFAAATGSQGQALALPPETTHDTGVSVASVLALAGLGALLLAIRRLRTLRYRHLPDYRTRRAVPPTTSPGPPRAELPCRPRED